MKAFKQIIGIGGIYVVGFAALAFVLIGLAIAEVSGIEEQDYE